MLIRNKRQFGFTLIEVIVAMLILSIAFLAVFKASMQSTHTVNAVEERQIAFWVAKQAMNAVIAGTINVENAKRETFQSTEMLGKEWKWHVSIVPVEHSSIEKIIVQVEDGPELTSYRVGRYE